MILELQYITIGLTFLFGLVGFWLPHILTKYKICNADSVAFMLTKGLSAGVIFSTGIMHLLPDGINAMDNAFDTDYPYGNLTVMLSIIIVMIIEQIIHTIYISYSDEIIYNNNEDNKDNNKEEKEEEISDDHTCHHEHTISNDYVYRHNRSFLQLLILEFGIAVHSIIIGFSFGLVDNEYNVISLMITLIVHQFTEGIAVGAVSITAEIIDIRSKIFLCSIFTLTTPIGIIIGMTLSDSVNDMSITFYSIQGILYCISTGLLIYISLVEFVAHELQKTTENINRLLFVFLFGIGTVIMSILAIWT
jgi:zinc transporter 1/2/3